MQKKDILGILTLLLGLMGLARYDNLISKSNPATMTLSSHIDETVLKCQSSITLDPTMITSPSHSSEKDLFVSCSGLI